MLFPMSHSGTSAPPPLAELSLKSRLRFTVYASHLPLGENCTGIKGVKERARSISSTGICLGTSAHLILQTNIAESVPTTKNRMAVIFLILRVIRLALSAPISNSYSNLPKIVSQVLCSKMQRAERSEAQLESQLNRTRAAYLVEGTEAPTA